MTKLPLSIRLLLCSILFVTTPALAQGDEASAADENDEDDAKDDDAKDAGAKGDGEQADDAAEGDKAAAEGADADASALAKPVLEETIYVVQGKRYLAQGRFELTPQFAWSVSDSFSSHSGLMISGLYHLKENVALELTAGLFGWWDRPGESSPRLGGRDSAQTTELKAKEGLSPERVKLYQFPYVIAGDLQWSPIYGKVNLQELVLAQFNLYLSVGAGVFGLQLETSTPSFPDKTFAELPGIIDGLPPAALTTTFGGGLRFYFNDWLGARVEVRDYVTPLSVYSVGDKKVEGTDKTSFDVTNTVLAQVGVSFVF